MNNRLGLLVALLVIQLVFIALWLFRQAPASETDAYWLTLNAGSVSFLSVADLEHEVILKRGDNGGWLVDELVADRNQIDEIIGKLADVQSPWPVANSEDSASRFEVGASNFQRHVKLEADNGVVAEFYLGTSPGFQRVHARVVDSDDIYSVQLSNYEFPVTVGGWLDKTQLATEEVLKQVEVNYSNLTKRVLLQQSDEGWLIDGVAANQELANTYANRFETLRVLNVSDFNVIPSQHMATIKLTLVGGEEKLLTLARVKHAQELGDLEARDQQQDEYFIQERNSDRWFVVAAYVAQQLLLDDIDLTQSSDGETD